MLQEQDAVPLSCKASAASVLIPVCYMAGGCLGAVCCIGVLVCRSAGPARYDIHVRLHLLLMVYDGPGPLRLT